MYLPGQNVRSWVCGELQISIRLLQVWTASLDGTLRLWDFLEGTELKSYDLGDAIVSLACTPAPCSDLPLHELLLWLLPHSGVQVYVSVAAIFLRP